MAGLREWHEACRRGGIRRLPENNFMREHWLVAALTSALSGNYESIYPMLFDIVAKVCGINYWHKIRHWPLGIN